MESLPPHFTRETDKVNPAMLSAFSRHSARQPQQASSRVSELLAHRNFAERVQASSLLLDHFDGPLATDSTTRRQILHSLMESSMVDDVWLWVTDVEIERALNRTAGWHGPRSKEVDRSSFARLLAVLSVVDLPANLPPCLVMSTFGDIHAEWNAAGTVRLEAVTDGRLAASLTRPNVEPIFEVKDINAIPEPGLEALNAHLRRLSQTQSSLFRH